MGERSFDGLRELVPATLESVSTAFINRYYGFSAGCTGVCINSLHQPVLWLLRQGHRYIQQKVQVRNQVFYYAGLQRASPGCMYRNRFGGCLGWLEALDPLGLGFFLREVPHFYTVSPHPPFGRPSLFKPLCLSITQLEISQKNLSQCDCSCCINRPSAFAPLAFVRYARLWCSYELMVSRADGQPWIYIDTHACAHSLPHVYISSVVPTGRQSTNSHQFSNSSL